MSSEILIKQETDGIITKVEEQEINSDVHLHKQTESTILHPEDDYHAVYSTDSTNAFPFQHPDPQKDAVDSYESSDDDFQPTPKYKQFVKKTAHRKRKSEKTDPSQNGTQSTAATVNKRRKSSSKKINLSSFNESEERLFVEGLELYGREWTKVQEHVATKSLLSIERHAQTYFSKLFRNGQQLPPKVAESGTDYTVSGQPLIHSSKADNKDVEALKIKNPETMNNTAPRYDENGRTTYSTSRLRKQKSIKNHDSSSDDEDPLTMVKCKQFKGKIGSDAPGSQPFELQIHSNVLLAMDFHAHLMTTEVIGFLAGEWDKEARCIKVCEAFPCRSLETEQNDVNVEMDPASAIETRLMIEGRNMKVVGWYHSHPIFVPDPSHVDIENQHNYQLLYRDDAASSRVLKPFVGAIISPYNPSSQSSVSAVNWFYVQNKDAAADRLVPKRLAYRLLQDDRITQDEEDRLFQLVEECEISPEKADFTLPWGKNEQENRLEKMIKSIGFRMPWVQRKLTRRTIIANEFLDKLAARLGGWGAE